MRGHVAIPISVCTRMSESVRMHVCHCVGVCVHACACTKRLFVCRAVWSTSAAWACLYLFVRKSRALAVCCMPGVPSGVPLHGPYRVCPRVCLWVCPRVCLWVCPCVGHRVCPPPGVCLWVWGVPLDVPSGVGCALECALRCQRLRLSAHIMRSAAHFYVCWCARLPRRVLLCVHGVLQSCAQYQSLDACVCCCVCMEYCDAALDTSHMMHVCVAVCAWSTAMLRSTPIKWCTAQRRFTFVCMHIVHLMEQMCTMYLLVRIAQLPARTSCKRIAQLPAHASCKRVVRAYWYML